MCIRDRERTVRLLLSCRKGERESSPGQLIFARHGHGDLVAEIIAAVDGIGEGRSVESLSLIHIWIFAQSMRESLAEETSISMPCWKV